MGFLEGLINSGILESNWPVTGNQANWPEQLIEYLNKLPSDHVIETIIRFLQKLIQTGQTIEKSTPLETLRLIREVQEQIQTLAGQNALPPIIIPDHQLFYEDTLCDYELDQVNTISELASKVQRLLPDELELPAGKRKDFLAFLESTLGTDETTSWIEAAKKFMEQGNPEAPADKQIKSPVPVRIAALLQSFEEGNETKIALNALYPGGGRLIARWLHLFPKQLESDFQNWDPRPVFPSNYFTNIRFRIESAAQNVAFPGSHSTRIQSLLPIEIQLQATDTRVNASFGNNHSLELNDQSLDVVEHRSPLLRLLHAVTTPAISLRMLRNKFQNEWESGDQVSTLQRTEINGLVLQRATMENIGICLEKLDSLGASPTVLCYTLIFEKSMLSPFDLLFMKIMEPFSSLLTAHS